MLNGPRDLASPINDLDEQERENLWREVNYFETHGERIHYQWRRGNAPPRDPEPGFCLPCAGGGPNNSILGVDNPRG